MMKLKMFVFTEVLTDYKNGIIVMVDEREFIISGVTPEEWSNTFGEDEEIV